MTRGCLWDDCIVDRPFKLSSSRNLSGFFTRPAHTLASLKFPPWPPRTYHESMSIELASAAVIAILLLGYLLFSIVRPDKF